MAIKQVDEFTDVAENLQYAHADFRIARLDAGFIEDEDDPEKIVDEYYKKLDYDTFKLRGLSAGKKAYLRKWFAFFDDFDFSQAGIPDFFVCRIFVRPRPNAGPGRNVTDHARVEDYRFVEVKGESDALRMLKTEQ